MYARDTLEQASTRKTAIRFGCTFMYFLVLTVYKKDVAEIIILGICNVMTLQSNNNNNNSFKLIQ